MSVFIFQWPWMLLGLSVLLPVGWLLARARRQRREVRVALGHPESESVKWCDWIWMSVVAVLVICLARPGYDPVRHSISKLGRDVVFVLDISRSMLAQDAYPSRLEAAKQGIRDCLDGFRGEQVALVIYAGSSTISCPLTADYEFLRYMLTKVEPRSVEFGGTMLLSAVEKVVDQVLDSERRGFQDLVILTDGEDHGPDMKRVAETIKESGVNSLIVGLGDSVSGSRIPILNEDGNVISLKYSGSVVYTKLQDRVLGELARLSPDSQYEKLGTLPFHLGEIYREFAIGKEATVMGGEGGYVVYREAAFFLMPVAFVLVLLRRLRLGEGKADV